MEDTFRFIDLIDKYDCVFGMARIEISETRRC